MKVAFSTLGCPEWSWSEILATAKDLGFDGIEVRGIGKELYAPAAGPFSEDSIDATKERLASLKLEIPLLSSSCCLSEKDRVEKNMKEAMEYVDLAQKLGVPYVRVLGDREPCPGTDADFMLVFENVAAISQYAESRGVAILLETNGIFAKSGNIASLMEKSARKNLGVLWDVHHPYRFFNEPVETTFGVLKDYVRFVHIKDSALEGGKIRYKMMGHGDVPVEDALKLLKKNRFEGYVSLEWVKRWCMDLEDPWIVYPHFVDYVRKVLGQW